MTRDPQEWPPATWTCCECKRVFPNGPFDPAPVGLKTDTRVPMYGEPFAVVVGKLCAECMK